MAEFYVEWRIEVDAETAEAAAKLAYKIMRDRAVTTHVFHVFPEGVDAEEEVVVDLGNAGAS